jgi:hypothetical protein
MEVLVTMNRCARIHFLSLLSRERRELPEQLRITCLVSNRFDAPAQVVDQRCLHHVGLFADLEGKTQVSLCGLRISASAKISIITRNVSDCP